MKNTRKYFWSKITTRDGQTLWMSIPCRTRREAEYQLEKAMDVFDFPDISQQKVVSCTYVYEDTPPRKKQ